MTPPTTSRCVCTRVTSRGLLDSRIVGVLTRSGGGLRGVTDELWVCPGCGAVSVLDVAGVVAAPTWAGRPVGLG